MRGAPRGFHARLDLGIGLGPELGQLSVRLAGGLGIALRFELTQALQHRRPEETVELQARERRVEVTPIDGDRRIRFEDYVLSYAPH